MDVLDVLLLPDSGLVFQSHPNWKWVIAEVTKNAESDEDQSVRYAALPSQKSKPKVRNPPKTLFRIERVDRHGNLVAASWCTHRGNDPLGAKDCLVDLLRQCGLESSHPPSGLVDWRSESVDDVEAAAPAPCDADPGPLCPPPLLVLKAALGYGGTDVNLFERSQEGFTQALTMIKEHAARARSEPGFLDSLLAEHGRIPQWVLQSHVPSLLVDRRKIHLRVYVVVVNGLLMLYQGLDYAAIEVRLAGKKWPESMPDEQAMADFIKERGVHITNGAGGNGTERGLLFELDGVSQTEAKVIQTEVEKLISSTFAPLSKALVERQASSSVVAAEERNPAMADACSVSGVDIMVDSSGGKVFLLEVNNNPAMPPKENLSESFHAHIVNFVRSFVTLSLAGDDAATMAEGMGYRVLCKYGV